MSFRWLTVLATAALGSALAVACSSSKGGGATFDSGPTDDATVDSGDDADANDEPQSLFDATNDVNMCATHCSADLHDVLDCNNTVLMTCPADQGCAAGACVAACDSAKANKSTIGCDYYVADPEEFAEHSQSCFAAYVANTWTTPVTISVDYAGQKLNAATFSRIPSGSGQSITYGPLPNGQLPPGKVAIVFLAYDPTGGGDMCPAGVTAAVTNAPVALLGTGTANAFHVSTDRPVVAYDIYPYGGGSSAITSATLLIPTSAWDTNYITQSGYPQSTIIPASEDPWPFTQVVGMADGTKFTISPTADIIGGMGVAATAKGKPHTYTVNKGQIIQFAQPMELTGSVLQSTSPVGVWGGHNCFNVKVTDYACDSAHQQIPPVKALGHEYVGVRYRNRVDNMEETVPWRVVGAVDGTKLTYDPAQTGAPATLNNGQIAEFDSTGPFSVKSQDDKHPFYVSGHMTGGQNANGAGDPEWVNIIPPQQYLASYVFFTDPTYPETNLVFVRQKGPNGFADVKLDCVGNLTGWTAVGKGGLYEYTRVDLVRHNFQPQGKCDNGLHLASSTVPFALTVWGWGTSEAMLFSTYASYAYPGGASVQPINTVVIPPNPK
jgi:hypothetical protein